MKPSVLSPFFHGAAVTLLLLGAMSDSATAESFTFEVGNGLEPSNTYITSVQVAALDQSGGSFENNGATFQRPSSGSYTYASQFGANNTASTYTSRSGRAAIATLQLDDDNSSQAVIIDSPGSVIAQFQLGVSNSSDVAIIGGYANEIATLQAGNGLGISLGLIDSSHTQIVYGQVGSGYSGSVVFRNAPAGTVIRLSQ